MLPNLTIQEIFGICFYYWYGSGGHQSVGKLPLSISGTDLINADGKWVSTIRATSKYGVHRSFVDSWRVAVETQTLRVITKEEYEINQSPDDFILTSVNSNPVILGYAKKAPYSDYNGTPVHKIYYQNAGGYLAYQAILNGTDASTVRLTIKTEPTEQNFYFDSYFKLMKAHNITNIWSVSGCFDWYVPYLNGKSQRKTACYNPLMSPTDKLAWADLAEFCKLIVLKYKDTGLLDYIQILNEWDFRWNVPHILTPEEYAVGFYVCYRAIRAISPDFKIMTGCTLTPDMATATRFFDALDALCVADGFPLIRDVIYTFNNYIRTQSDNQGSGIGATPEQMNRYAFYKALNDYCVEKGIEGCACTESGWNTSPSNSVDAKKQKAPLLQGFTLEESQGILMIRLALIMASLPKFKALTFYHCKDGYEAEPFTYIGINYDTTYGGKPDWSAKPARILNEQFLAKYGQSKVVRFYQNQSGYYAELDNGKTLGWSDIQNVGNLTPMPTEVTVTPPPTGIDAKITVDYNPNEVNFTLTIN